MKKILKSISLMSLAIATVLLGFGSSIAQAATYTMADVATHHTPADCWVVVNNNVYNLTSYVTSHSGGASVIEAQCGKNGTASFNSGPHSGSSLSAISSYLLGTLTTTPVVLPILTSLTVVPSAPTIIVGGNIHLTATPKDQNGVKFIGATTTFSSSNTAIATVGSTSGKVIGISVGTTTITATSIKGAITLTKTSTVTVSATAPTLILDSVKVTPASSSVKIGKTVQLSVVTKDQNGVKFEGAITTFKSSDSGIAKVDSGTGLVTGVALGSVTITATSISGNEEVTGTAVVKVIDTTIKTINQDNNGKHLGQFKNWFKNWFKNHNHKWEKMNDQNEKNNHSQNVNNNQNNKGNNDTEENDD